MIDALIAGGLLAVGVAAVWALATVSMPGALAAAGITAILLGVTVGILKS